METLRNQLIRGVKVPLDDKTFIDCRLIDCVLVYDGGPVAFEHTCFSKCRYVLTGNARRTIDFLQGTGLMPHDPAEWGEFSESVN